MCSQLDDPTTYDPPETTRPRTYVLTGDRPAASVALAVIGTMLTEAEKEADGEDDWPALRRSINDWVIPTLLEARDRIAEAEKTAR